MSLCTFFLINTSCLLRAALYRRLNYVWEILMNELGVEESHSTGGWESFLFIPTTNCDQRPEMHFAYI